MQPLTRLLCLSLLIQAGALHAQTLPMQDFALFGKDAVQISTSTSVSGGRIGSNTLINVTGSSTLSSSVHSGGRITIGNSTSVTGSISSANATVPPASGTIFQVGSNTSLNGRIDVNGNIAINSGTVSGPVYTSGTYTGPNLTTGTPQPGPSFPVLPGLSANLVAANYATQQAAITATKSITPGSYAGLALTGSQTLTFTTPGDYVFGSIANSGNFNKLVFDFNGKTNAVFRIFVTSNVDLYKISIGYLNLSINGSAPSNTDLAQRIVMQVQGTGGSNGYAWSITNGASGNNQSTWLGTVIAPNGSISIGNGSSQAKIVGSLWSGKTVYVQSGVSMTYAAALGLCNTPVISNSGPTAFCSGGSVVLTSSSDYGNQCLCFP